MTQSKLLFRAALTMIATALTASFATSAAHAYPHTFQAESFTASVGNHSSITIENDPHLLVISWSRENGTRRYIFNWAEEKLMMESSEGVTTIEAKTKSKLLVPVLKKMLDLAAYTEVPQRFTWSNGGSQVLNKKLQPIVERLKIIVKKYDQNAADEANCIVYQKEADNENGLQFRISAGIQNDLGDAASLVNTAWVRGGYALVLVPAPDLSLEAGPAVVLQNPEGKDETFPIDSVYGSMACRPALY